MLIKTKTTPPSLKSHMLLRRDLIEQLCAAEKYPFISISGPAGSGKTSLACQWIREAHLQTAWFSMDQEDNEPDLFYRYLIAALVGANEGLHEALGPMLENRKRLTGELVIPRVIESLFGVERKMNLIMDDFHHIENKELSDAIARFIQYLPKCLQIVVLSRHNLPTSIDAVTFKKECLKISAADLKFDESETAVLFNTLLPSSFSAEQIRELNRYFDGWIAGLQLIGLSVRAKGVGADMSNLLTQARDQATSYLINDLLKMMPEKIRSFVLATGHLDRFNPELCAEVTGQEDAAGILDQLEQMNLFLIPLDTKRKWYRYHHIFSEVIRRQGYIHDPELIAKTLRKAALWFAANNHLEDAIRSAFESRDLEFVADLMEKYITIYAEQANPNAGLRWIAKLPLDILIQRTLLRLYQCVSLLMLMEFSEIREILATIENQNNMALTRYSEKKQILCKDYIIFFKSILQILDINQPEEIKQFEALSEKIAQQHHFFLIGTEMISAITLLSKGELTSSEMSYERAYRLMTRFETPGRKIHLARARALIARHQGRLHQAEANITEALKSQERKESGNTSMQFLLHRQLGHIYYLQNRLAEARQCNDLAVKYCEQSGLLEELMTGDELCLLLQFADGKKEQTAECIRQMRVYALKLGMPQIAACADAWSARMAVAQGYIAPAEVWSRRRNLQIDEPFSLIFAIECLTLAHVYFASGQYSNATGLLEALRIRCFKRTLFEFTLEIDIFHSAVLQAMNQHQKARTLLKKALAFSEIEGYVRPFVNYAELIKPILISLTDKRPNDSLAAHLGRVCAACNLTLWKPIDPLRLDNSVTEDLTLRETEILDWISKGFQNKEIAQKTFISTNTVKVHVRKILAKLKVRSRTQACIKAKKLGILD